MDNASVDYHALFFLKKLLNDKLTLQEKLLFKSQFACQTRMTGAPGVEDAVFLLRSDKDRAAFAGLNHCNNPWFCPVCSARKMSKYRQRIAIAIDALKKKGYRGMMITFTIPHNNWYSTEDTFEILKNSMAKFQKHSGNQINAKKFCSNAWTRMYREMKFCHYVRMAEVTFGSNGVHPHYHCIYWTKKPLQLAKIYEREVNNFWLKIVRQETKKQFYKTKGEKYTKEEINGRVDEIFDRLSEDTSFYISRNNRDQITAVKSSSYIAGWGSDSELTHQERKTAADGHFSQWDLLEILAGYKKANINRDWAEKMFLEFAIYIKKKNFYKAKFSLTKDDKNRTLNKLVEEYKKTVACSEFIKKNYAENWVTVCWFTREQWFKISELNRKIPVLSNILYLSYDTLLLKNYLESLEIFAFNNHQHRYQKAYEDLFNHAA